MKKCTVCGEVAENNNLLICNKCGGAFTEVVNDELQICINCGSDVKAGDEFCRKCGCKIGATEVEAEKRYIREEKKNSGKGLVVIFIVVMTIFIIAVMVLVTFMLTDRLENRSDKDRSDDVQNNVSTANDETGIQGTNNEEEERLAREAEEKQREEEERLAREVEERRKAEEERLAREAEERRKAEEERLAREAEERQKAEEERLARETEENMSYENNDIRISDNLYDYDYDNDDWYRLRKSKWDASTQVGAYKTVEKALEYAEIYVPQGYVLYDKDFNVVAYWG